METIVDKSRRESRQKKNRRIRGEHSSSSSVFHHLSPLVRASGNIYCAPRWCFRRWNIARACITYLAHLYCFRRHPIWERARGERRWARESSRTQYRSFGRLARNFPLYNTLLYGGGGGVLPAFCSAVWLTNSDSTTTWYATTSFK